LLLQIHHSERFNGVPYGLFFGPQELEAIGGGEYLDMLVEQSDPKVSRAEE
jgi:beta-carotene 3-hydroxylase